MTSYKILNQKKVLFENERMTLFNYHEQTKSGDYLHLGQFSGIGHDLTDAQLASIAKYELDLNFQQFNKKKSKMYLLINKDGEIKISQEVDNTTLGLIKNFKTITLVDISTNPPTKYHNGEWHPIDEL